ncbi:hypothetical protein [Enterobacter roggenkampii]|uniref:hypothetical protein n=1 Tax=Enterobacter roggenkampii TaxID=1812935 RepID=UPI002002D0CB|nr:hypothetical protein [Enterobacter roggenkampii]MCK7047601.1 hypothetical protein [Enterobacter roggenkampii]
MGESAGESLKQVLEDRLKNPLWGFIILAWVWFNWPNIAMLFMSDEPVKLRIDYILNQEHFYLAYIVRPFVIGALLAIVSPYAQWLLSKAHKWADDRYSDNIFQGKERVYQDDIKLSKLKVQSLLAEQAETARINADIQADTERGKREQLITEELESQKKVLEEKIELLSKKFEEEQLELEEVIKEKQKLQDLAVQVSTLLEKSLRLENSNSVAQLVDEISDLFTVAEFEESEERNASKVTRKKRLTVAELLERVKASKDEVANNASVASSASAIRLENE